MKKHFITIIFLLMIVNLSACNNATKDNTEKQQSISSKVTDEVTMKVFYYPDYDSNYYLLVKNGRGVLIDAGGCADEIIEYINSKGIQIEDIILTHGHFDHVKEVDNLKNKLKSKILISEKDKDLYKETCKTDVDKYIVNEQTLDLAGMSFDILFTPGHTPGSISLKTNNFIFTGDTLFRESIGRTDLGGGNYNDIINSIKSKLFILPDELKVFPGHGAESSIGYEKQNNMITALP